MESWVSLTAPFADRIFGHQQVTEAYLLGLAIQQDGVLVTFDRTLRYMAGPRFAQHLHLPRIGRRPAGCAAAGISPLEARRSGIKPSLAGENPGKRGDFLSSLY
jgi:hypothetical protein